MGKKRKLLEKLLSGSRNVSFDDTAACARALGFRLDRVNGSHHIFVHDGCGVMLNLQDVKGKAKPYQIKQLLQIIEANDLRLEDDE
jgi:predicted RNA binding protein YcfA (HicA-like mRNA interferase family)